MRKIEEQLPAAGAAGRRRFLQVMAGSAAALMVGAMVEPRQSAAQSRSDKEQDQAPKRTNEIEAELKNQKDFVAKTLKTIRGFELPPGSEAGFLFRPIRKPAAVKPRKSR